MYAIHFVCSACGKHLEVDEQGAGAIVHCTDCSAALTVPQRTAKATCPHCHVAVRVADNLWGQSIECSTCRKTFPVQNPNDPAPRALYIHFKCPSCGKHLEVEEKGAGMIVPCTDCSTPLKVPHRTAQLTCPHCRVPVLVAENLWGQMIECSNCWQPIHVQNPNDPIQHACPYCYVVVLVDPQLKGQFIECPTCHRKFHVPNRDRDVELEGDASESLF